MTCCTETMKGFRQYFEIWRPELNTCLAKILCNLPLNQTHYWRLYLHWLTRLMDSDASVSCPIESLIFCNASMAAMFLFTLPPSFTSKAVSSPACSRTVFLVNKSLLHLHYRPTSSISSMKGRRGYSLETRGPLRNEVLSFSL